MPERSIEDDGAKEERSVPNGLPHPTAQDRENAATRQAIARRQTVEFVYCLKLAFGALGPGWQPWMKLVLIESDYHLHRDMSPVIGATVYRSGRGADPARRAKEGVVN